MLKVLCSARSKNNSISPAAVILTGVLVVNTMSSKKNSHVYGCAFIMCIGRPDKPDAACQMCDAPVHVGCVKEVLCGLPTDEVTILIVCLPQYFRYYKDDALSSEEIKESWLCLLMAQNKMELRKLAWDLGAKVSYHVPGGTPHDLSKEGVIMQIIEKMFGTVQTETDNNASNNNAGAGGSGEQQIITIHDKF